MRNRIAYWIVDNALRFIATKDYRAFVGLTSKLGAYTLEKDLLNLEELTLRAELGKWIYENWDDSDMDLYLGGTKDYE